MPAVTGVGALSPTGDVLDADGWTNKKTATVTPADTGNYLCLPFKISSGINRIDGKLEKRGDAELDFGVLADDLHDLELAPIGWQLFVLEGSPSDQTASYSAVGTFSTHLLAQPLNPKFSVV